MLVDSSTDARDNNGECFTTAIIVDMIHKYMTYYVTRKLGLYRLVVSARVSIVACEIH